ncbi:MAG: mechanosensitive ion channel domain-containing protein [Pseudomonadales bacterium]
MDELDLENVNHYVDVGITMGMTYAPRLILAIVTLVVGIWIVNRLTQGVVRAFERAGMDETLSRFSRNLVNIGLKALLLISVASMIGIETTSFIAVLAAAGLAVGLALQGSLGNFAGGVLILMFKPYRVGDFIDTSGHAGTVREIGIFNTMMTTPDNKTIYVPNGAIANSAITNFSSQPTRRVDIVFGISYDDDLRVAKEILRGLIESDDRILKDPGPVIVVSSLGDNSVNITTRSWVAAPDYWPVLFDLTESTKLAFDEAGITIPYPQRDVHVHQEGS